MDSTTIIQVVAGVLFVIVLIVLIQRRRTRVKKRGFHGQASVAVSCAASLANSIIPLSGASLIQR